MRRVIAILAMLLLAGCYEVTITNTVHPDTGVVEVELIIPSTLTDLDDELVESGGSGILPTSYIVEVDGESYAMGSDGKLVLPTFFDPGVYTITVYSVSEGVSYSDGIASVDMDDDGFVDSNPALFLFGTQTLTVMADSNQLSELAMMQVVGVVNIDLEIINGDPDNIVAATAVMSGLAGQWDCIEDAVCGDAVATRPSITQGGALTRSGEDNSHLTSSLSMVGTNGEEQILEMTLTLLNGAVEVTTGDISSLLSGFNLDKGSAITISNTIWMPADVELGGLDIVVGDWVASDVVMEGDTN